MKQQQIEKRAKAYKAMEDLMNANGGQLTSDQEKQYQQHRSDYTDANTTLQRLEQHAKVEAQMSEVRQAEAEQRQQKPQEMTKEARVAKERDALITFLKGGRNALSAEQRKFVHFDKESRGTNAQKTTPDSAGGFLIGSDLASSINLARKYTSDLEAACTVIVTPTGKTINYPKIDDTATNAEQYTEASRDTTPIPVADITVGNTDINAYFYSSKWVKMTLESIQDIEYSLNSFLMPLLSARVDRVKSAQLTNGDGLGKPNGLITTATLGKTAASATAITTEELMDLFRSVDKSYRTGNQVGWMFHDSIEGQIMKLGLTPSENYNPITFNNNGEMLVMGKRTYINNDMDATLATTKKVALFGDFSQYIIRRVANPGLIMTSERFIDSGHYGYMQYERIDGEYVGAANAIKYLQMA